MNQTTSAQTPERAIHVLLIDHSDARRGLLRGMLTSPQWDVREAGTYREAVGVLDDREIGVTMQGGLVYAAFNRREHVQAVSVRPGCPLLWALDFNVDPMSSVVAQLDGERVFVIDEIVKRHASTEEACEEFIKRFPRHDAGVVSYGDASGNSQKTSGSSDYQIVREYFRTHYAARIAYKVPKSNPSVRERVMLTNSKLRAASGDVCLVVDARCKEVIKDLEQVSYKAESTAIDKDKDRRRTHLSDALGYLLWQECRPQAAMGEHTERLI